MACAVCGEEYLRCNCVSQQPYCEQCSGNNTCAESMNSACVFYHPDNESPSLLINLGLSNNTSTEDILEAIDARLGQIIAQQDPNSSTDSSTIDFTLTGVNNRHIQATVKVSSVAGNEISIKSDGLYSSYSGKVKVDSTDALDYLDAQIVGGSVDPYVQCSIIKDNGVLEVTPTLNFNALREALNITSTSVQDTNSIDLTSNVVLGVNQITASAKISATAGNNITINADGLYVPTPTSSTVTANNALTKVFDNVQLGGVLVQNTTIDHANTYQLSFTNGPRVSIGSSTTTNSYLSVSNTSTTTQFTSIVSSQYALDNTSTAGFYSTMDISGGAFTHNNNLYKFSNGGQLNFLNTGAITLGSSQSCIYTGVYGVIGVGGTGNITGNIIAGGYFQGAAVGGANVVDMAAIRANGLNSLQVPTAYTGTVTNFYGLHIDDISTSNFGNRITNRFAIYQRGTTDISRFFGPVQNASSSNQFTSDKRVKENIVPFTRGLAELRQIDAKKFNYTYNQDRTVTGVIAQELEKILPEAVEIGNFSTPKGEEFTDFRMVDQTTLFYTMLNAIKELAAKVEALENN
jgi:hypothetical protein